MLLPAVLGLTALLAVLAPLLGHRLGREAGWPIAAGLLALGLWLGLAAPREGLTHEMPWIPALDVGLRLRLDGLSLVFALLVLIIGAAVMAYSARYLSKKAHTGFYGLMTLFAAAMLLLVTADDVVVLFVAWEATTFCSFFLITRSGAPAHQPAVRVLLVTATGGLALLAAVVTMSVRTGTTQLSAILTDDAWRTDPGFATVVAVLLAVAAFTKSAQFPFHSWLPDAMAASTPVSAYLHAAAMVKAGIYLLLRFSPAMSGVPAWHLLLISLGITTALIGSLFALQRTDLKALLAYSTVSQLGFLVATIGVGTEHALTAAVVHTVAHALFKSALFMVVGVIDHQAGSRDIRDLSGLRRCMPLTTVVVVLGAASMAGVPPLLGFVSKESMFAAFLEAPGPAWTGPVLGVLGVSAAVLTFAYCGRMVTGAFFGPPMRETWHHDTHTDDEDASGHGEDGEPHTHPGGPPEAGAAFLLPPALPALAGLGLGLAPFLLDDLVSRGAGGAHGAEVDAHLELWHGVNPELFMSAAVIVLGALLVAARHRVDRLLDRPLLPYTGVGAVEGFRRGAISLGARVGGLTGSSAPARHLAAPLVLLLVLTAVALPGLGGLPPVVGDLDAGTDWVLLGIVALGVLAAVVVRSRIGALSVVGITGFGVALWFVALGAADVALTQLLVEILTVVAGVLVLRRLPAAFGKVRRARAAGAAVLAVASGAAATVGVLALTGRRELSAAGEWYLREGETETGGTNVVNTILVDFRALDTLGELTVLGLAGVAILVALQARRALPEGEPGLAVGARSPLLGADDNAAPLRVLARAVGPVMVVTSLWFLLRGHNAPGGGFISALVGGAGFALVYLASSTDRGARVKWPYLALIGGGVLVGTATGLAGLADGSFLRPLHAYVLGYHFTTALVFDLGVYLAVVGVVLVALNRLGGVVPEDAVPGAGSPTPGTPDRAGDPPGEARAAADTGHRAPAHAARAPEEVP
ncbi:DUF4040 family protein [Kineococcus sp. SYSU DK004]|uniref:DUF4040 family protein n=1 Tax=Kineococcus sp. SYSU DK004 TaxID=3383125 RepID=UPI003D7D7F26